MTEERKLCKDCPHFIIRMEYESEYSWGMAECKKHNLITDFRSHRKFENLTCVEQEGE